MNRENNLLEQVVVEVEAEKLANYIGSVIKIHGSIYKLRK